MAKSGWQHSCRRLPQCASLLLQLLARPLLLLLGPVLLGESCVEDQ